MPICKAFLLFRQKDPQILLFHGDLKKRKRMARDGEASFFSTRLETFSIDSDSRSVLKASI